MASCNLITIICLYPLKGSSGYCSLCDDGGHFPFRNEPQPVHSPTIRNIGYCLECYWAQCPFDLSFLLLLGINFGVPLHIFLAISDLYFQTIAAIPSETSIIIHKSTQRRFVRTGNLRPGTRSTQAVLIYRVLIMQVMSLYLLLHHLYIYLNIMF